MTNRSEYLIPVTLHLAPATFRMLEVTAKRATLASGRKVEISELIESRLDATTSSDPARAVAPQRTAAERQTRSRLTDEQSTTIRQMTEAGRTATEIRAVVGCSRQTVHNYRRALRAATTNER